VVEVKAIEKAIVGLPILVSVDLEWQVVSEPAKAANVVDCDVDVVSVTDVMVHANVEQGIVYG
jgi:hypothetical protein